MTNDEYYARILHTTEKEERKRREEEARKREQAVRVSNKVVKANTSQSSPKQNSGLLPSPTPTPFVEKETAQNNLMALLNDSALKKEAQEAPEYDLDSKTEELMKAGEASASMVYSLEQERQKLLQSIPGVADRAETTEIMQRVNKLNELLAFYRAAKDEQAVEETRKLNEGVDKQLYGIHKGTETYEVKPCTTAVYKNSNLAEVVIIDDDRFLTKSLDGIYTIGKTRLDGITDLNTTIFVDTQTGEYYYVNAKDSADKLANYEKIVQDNYAASAREADELSSWYDTYNKVNADYNATLQELERLESLYYTTTDQKYLDKYNTVAKTLQSKYDRTVALQDLVNKKCQEYMDAELLREDLNKRADAKLWTMADQEELDHLQRKFDNGIATEAEINQLAKKKAEQAFYGQQAIVVSADWRDAAIQRAENMRKYITDAEAMQNLVHTEEEGTDSRHSFLRALTATIGAMTTYNRQNSLKGDISRAVAGSNLTEEEWENVREDYKKTMQETFENFTTLPRIAKNMAADYADISDKWANGLITDKEYRDAIKPTRNMYLGYVLNDILVDMSIVTDLFSVKEVVSADRAAHGKLADESTYQLEVRRREYFGDEYVTESKKARQYMQLSLMQQFGLDGRSKYIDLTTNAWRHADGSELSSLELMAAEFVTDIDSWMMVLGLITDEVKLLKYTDEFSDTFAESTKKALKPLFGELSEDDDKMLKDTLKNAIKRNMSDAQSIEKVYREAFQDATKKLMQNTPDAADRYSRMIDRATEVFIKRAERTAGFDFSKIVQQSAFSSIDEIMDGVSRKLGAVLNFTSYSAFKTVQFSLNQAIKGASLLPFTVYRMLGVLERFTNLDVLSPKYASVIEDAEYELAIDVLNGSIKFNEAELAEDISDTVMDSYIAGSYAKHVTEAVEALSKGSFDDVSTALQEIADKYSFKTFDDYMKALFKGFQEVRAKSPTATIMMSALSERYDLVRASNISDVLAKQFRATDLNVRHVLNVVSGKTVISTSDTADLHLHIRDAVASVHVDGYNNKLVKDIYNDYKYLLTMFDKYKSVYAVGNPEYIEAIERIARNIKKYNDSTYERVVYSNNSKLLDRYDKGFRPSKYTEKVLNAEAADTTTALATALADTMQKEGVSVDPEDLLGTVIKSVIKDSDSKVDVKALGNLYKVMPTKGASVYALCTDSDVDKFTSMMLDYNTARNMLQKGTKGTVTELGSDILDSQNTSSFLAYAKNYIQSAAAIKAQAVIIKTLNNLEVPKADILYILDAITGSRTTINSIMEHPGKSMKDVYATIIQRAEYNLRMDNDAYPLYKNLLCDTEDTVANVSKIEAQWDMHGNGESVVFFSAGDKFVDDAGNVSFSRYKNYTPGVITFKYGNDVYNFTQSDVKSMREFIEGLPAGIKLVGFNNNAGNSFNFYKTMDYYKIDCYHSVVDLADIIREKEGLPVISARTKAALEQALAAAESNLRMYNKALGTSMAFAIDPKDTTFISRYIKNYDKDPAVSRYVDYAKRIDAKLNKKAYYSVGTALGLTIDTGEIDKLYAALGLAPHINIARVVHEANPEATLHKIVDRELIDKWLGPDTNFSKIKYSLEDVTKIVKELECYERMNFMIVSEFGDKKVNWVQEYVNLKHYAEAMEARDNVGYKIPYNVRRIFNLFPVGDLNANRYYAKWHKARPAKYTDFYALNPAHKARLNDAKCAALCAYIIKTRQDLYTGSPALFRLSSIMNGITTGSTPISLMAENKTFFNSIADVNKYELARYDHQIDDMRAYLNMRELGRAPSVVNVRASQAYEALAALQDDLLNWKSKIQDTTELKLRRDYSTKIRGMRAATNATKAKFFETAEFAAKVKAKAQSESDLVELIRRQTVDNYRFVAYNVLNQTADSFEGFLIKFANNQFIIDPNAEFVEASELGKFLQRIKGIDNLVVEERVVESKKLLFIHSEGDIPSLQNKYANYAVNFEFFEKFEGVADKSMMPYFPKEYYFSSGNVKSNDELRILQKYFPSEYTIPPNASGVAVNFDCSILAGPDVQRVLNPHYSDNYINQYLTAIKSISDTEYWKQDYMSAFFTRFNTLPEGMRLDKEAIDTIYDSGYVLVNNQLKMITSKYHFTFNGVVPSKMSYFVLTKEQFDEFKALQENKRLKDLSNKYIPVDTPDTISSAFKAYKNTALSLQKSAMLFSSMGTWIHNIQTSGINALTEGLQNGIEGFASTIKHYANALQYKDFYNAIACRLDDFTDEGISKFFKDNAQYYTAADEKFFRLLHAAESSEFTDIELQGFEYMKVVEQKEMALGRLVGDKARDVYKIFNSAKTWEDAAKLLQNIGVDPDDALRNAYAGFEPMHKSWGTILTELHPIMRFNAEKFQNAETRARLAVFLASVDSGETISKAANRVKATQFTYNSNKGVFDVLFPFMSYTNSNFTYMTSYSTMFRRKLSYRFMKATDEFFVSPDEAYEEYAKYRARNYYLGLDNDYQSAADKAYEEFLASNDNLVNALVINGVKDFTGLPKSFSECAIGLGDSHFIKFGNSLVDIVELVGSVWLDIAIAKDVKDLDRPYFDGMFQNSYLYGRMYTPIRSFYDFVESGMSLKEWAFKNKSAAISSIPMIGAMASTMLRDTKSFFLNYKNVHEMILAMFNGTYQANALELAAGIGGIILPSYIGTSNGEDPAKVVKQKKVPSWLLSNHPEKYCSIYARLMDMGYTYDEAADIMSVYGDLRREGEHVAYADFAEVAAELMRWADADTAKLILSKRQYGSQQQINDWYLYTIRALDGSVYQYDKEARDEILDYYCSMGYSRKEAWLRLYAQKDIVLQPDGTLKQLTQQELQDKKQLQQDLYNKSLQQNTGFDYSDEAWAAYWAEVPEYLHYTKGAWKDTMDYYRYELGYSYLEAMQKCKEGLCYKDGKIVDARNLMVEHNYKQAQQYNSAEEYVAAVQNKLYAEWGYKDFYEFYQGLPDYTKYTKGAYSQTLKMLKDLGYGYEDRMRIVHDGICAVSITNEELAALGQKQYQDVLQYIAENTSVQKEYKLSTEDAAAAKALAAETHAARRPGLSAEQYISQHTEVSETVRQAALSLVQKAIKSGGGIASKDGYILVDVSGIVKARPTHSGSYGKRGFSRKVYSKRDYTYNPGKPKGVYKRNIIAPKIRLRQPLTDGRYVSTYSVQNVLSGASYGARQLYKTDLRQFGNMKPASLKSATPSSYRNIVYAYRRSMYKDLYAKLGTSRMTMRTNGTKNYSNPSTTRLRRNELKYKSK